MGPSRGAAALPPGFELGLVCCWTESHWARGEACVWQMSGYQTAQQ